MNFDSYAYLDANFSLDRNRADAYEQVIDCILPSCGKPKHLYYNIKKNLWDCKRCGANGNLVSFVMHHRGIGYAEACVFLQGADDTLSKIKAIKEKIKIYSATIDMSGGGEKIKITPGSYFDKQIYTEEMFLRNKHLKRRRVSYDVWNNIMPKPVYCLQHSDSRFWQCNNRVLFPIVCDGHVSFQAYDITGTMTPKTWNPPGNINSELLFLYDKFKNDKKPLVVVEGIFDCLRVLSIDNEVNSVALLGSNVSAYQAYLLGKTRSREVILMLDGDVIEKKSQKILDKYYDYLKMYCDNFSIVTIPDVNKDPGNLTKDEYFDVKKSRRRYGVVSQIRMRLSHVH